MLLKVAMIYAEATPLAENHLRLVINYPDGSQKTPVTVADASEARRLVYFYNRQYIKQMFKEWLAQRVNAFKHSDVADSARINTSAMLLVAIEKHSNGLHVLCRLIVGKTANIKTLAPRDQSRHYKKYQDIIIPILKFCHEMEGKEYE
ncbi:hypothetical protein [Mucilaginibacter sp.]|uniref:hypothetical protein n=1 Tax=Mucilaginibacter sp. TaxID=1882438 RepID=UPI0025EE1953|nr:hypothetical protein [Mucilaginibacter sp.]